MWPCVQVCMICDTGQWYYYVTMCAGVHDLQCRGAVSHWVRGHRGVGICAHRVHEPSPHQVHAALLSLIQLWHHFVSWNNVGNVSRKQSCLAVLEASFKILGDEVWSPYVSKASALSGACRTMQSHQWCVCVYVCSLSVVCACVCVFVCSVCVHACMCVCCELLKFSIHRFIKYQFQKIS